MATYEELFGLINNSDLRNKVCTAVGVAGDTINSEDTATPNHTNRVLWAQDAFGNPQRMAERVFWSVIVANKSSTVAQIRSASDASIQTTVDAVVDIFATDPPASG